MNNILKVVTDIGGEVHTEPVGSDDDENIDDHGHMVNGDYDWDGSSDDQCAHGFDV